MTNIIEKVLKKIKEDDIKPRPRWEFLLKNYVFWSIGIISLIIGSAAFSGVLYMIINSEWKMYMHFSNSLLKYILLTLPYFWVVFLALFIVVAQYNFKHTDKGYRYRFHYIVAATIIVSVLGGVIFYNIGASQAIDDILSEKMPYYHHVINPKIKIWTQGDRGLAAGMITSLLNEEIFELEDIERRIWQINSSQAEIMPLVEIIPGERVRVIGQNQGKQIIEAQIIMPMGPGRGMIFRHPGMREMFDCRFGAKNQACPHMPPGKIFERKK